LCSHRFEANCDYRFLLMNTRKIMCCLRDVVSFLGVFPSDLLPEYPLAESGTLRVNTDLHPEPGSHWLAIHFQPRSSTAYYFDSYCLPSLIPSIRNFIKRIAPSGITAPYSYKDLVQRSAANIAVSSHCTCIEVIRLKNSLGSLAP
jgi:hypothetical protein